MTSSLRQRENETGSGNTTIVIGCRPCPKCAARHSFTDDFHGDPLTVCVECGTELRS